MPQSHKKHKLYGIKPKISIILIRILHKVSHVNYLQPNLEITLDPFNIDIQFNSKLIWDKNDHF